MPAVFSALGQMLGGIPKTIWFSPAFVTGQTQTGRKQSVGNNDISNHKVGHQTGIEILRHSPFWQPVVARSLKERELNHSVQKGIVEVQFVEQDRSKVSVFPLSVGQNTFSLEPFSFFLTSTPHTVPTAFCFLSSKSPFVSLETLLPACQQLCTKQCISVRGSM